MYNELLDERKGTNLLLVADEEMEQVEVLRIGEFDAEWGVSALRPLPGHPDRFLAVRVRELSEPTPVVQSALGIFDLRGRFYTDPAWLPLDDELKFEGVELFPTL